MKVFKTLSEITGQVENSVMTIGSFDGVHLGHQELIGRVIRRAKEVRFTSIVFTFEPHPLKLLRPEKCPPILTPLKKKVSLMAEMGVDLLFCAEFNREFSLIEAEQFIENYLHKAMGMRELLVGYDFAFGRGRRGNIDMLDQLSAEYNFKLTVVTPYKIGDKIVSSTLLRKLTREGVVREAASLLGRFYSISGVVVKGYSKGKELGFPTANIDHQYDIIPRRGIYAAKAIVEGDEYNAVVNIGFNPTFNRDKLTIEAYLLDFNEDLYGREIEIEFVERLRDEEKFDSEEALTRQIAEDVRRAKEILSEAGGYAESGPGKPQ